MQSLRFIRISDLAMYRRCCPAGPVSKINTGRPNCSYGQTQTLKMFNKYDINVINKYFT